VTVFEKADRIGGLLRYGIPDFKMEKHLIDRASSRCGRRREFQTTRTWAEHSRRAICARVRRHPAGRRRRASARSESSGPRAEGHSLRHGVSAAAEQSACAGDTVPDQILATGKRVVIIGGGDTGADCLGTSHRQMTCAAANPWSCGLSPKAAKPHNPSIITSRDSLESAICRK
jgi:glutamate synthase (NADPH) small chain